MIHIRCPLSPNIACFVKLFKSAAGKCRVAISGPCMVHFKQGQCDADVRFARQLG